MKKWVLNNILSRKISYFFYNTKRIKLMRKMALQKKMFWCFILIVSTPLLLLTLLQSIYMTNYLPIKESLRIYSKIELYEKNLQYEFSILKQRIDILAYSSGLSEYLKIDADITEQEMAKKIVDMRSILSDHRFSDENSTFLSIYVNWDTPFKYLFNDDRVMLIDSFLQNELTQAITQMENGNLAVAFNVEGNDEISELGRSFNQMSERIHNLIETVYKTEIEMKNSELLLLQSQINPHFLYNTLDTINWLATSDENNQAAKMARSLADFFRFSLSAGSTLVFVEDEMKMVKNYLDIQKIRLDEKLEIVYNIDDDVMQLETLKLILQPIAENCILHGYGDAKQVLHITITAKKTMML